MASTLKDLLLALLNATLILVALCLFLGWKLASSVEGVTSAFADKVQIVAPLKDELLGVRGELSALRSELASMRSGDTAGNAAAEGRISDALIRLEALEQKMQATQARITDLAASPDALIETAIETSAGVVADRVIAIRGCVPAS